MASTQASPDKNFDVGAFVEDPAQGSASACSCLV